MKIIILLALILSLLLFSGLSSSEEAVISLTEGEKSDFTLLLGDNQLVKDTGYFVYFEFSRDVNEEISYHHDYRLEVFGDGVFIYFEEYAPVNNGMLTEEWLALHGDEVGTEYIHGYILNNKEYADKIFYEVLETELFEGGEIGRSDYEGKGRQCHIGLYVGSYSRLFSWRANEVDEIINLKAEEFAFSVIDYVKTNGEMIDLKYLLEFKYEYNEMYYMDHWAKPSSIERWIEYWEDDGDLSKIQANAVD